jgi:hypothetical protein
MRCLDDGREGMKRRRNCGFRRQLDFETLVRTRGRDLPLGRWPTAFAAPAAAAGAFR